MKSLIKKLKLAGMVIGTLSVLGALQGCESNTSTTPPYNYYTDPYCDPYLRIYNGSGEGIELDIYDNNTGALVTDPKFLTPTAAPYNFYFKKYPKNYHFVVKSQAKDVNGNAYVFVDTIVTVEKGGCSTQYVLNVPKYQPPVVSADASFQVTNYTSEHLSVYIEGVFQNVIDPSKAEKYTNIPGTYSVEVFQEHYNTAGNVIHQVSLYKKLVTLKAKQTLPIDITAVDPMIKIYNDTDLSTAFDVPKGGEKVFAFFNSNKQTFDSGYNDVLIGGFETFSFIHYEGGDYLKVNGEQTNNLYNNINQHFEENTIYEYHAL